MKQHEVPQHNAKALQGQRKAMYSLDDSGNYTLTRSSGWDVEEVVLDQAIERYQALTLAALHRAQRGHSAPLEYHMYERRMDPTILAQSTGFFRWQVKRHLRAGVFGRLSAAKLQRYAQALGMTETEVTRLPDSVVGAGDPEDNHHA